MGVESTSVERKPIFSKRTDKLLGRVSAEGIYFWEKINKCWELWTWEELERLRREQKEPKLGIIE